MFLWIADQTRAEDVLGTVAEPGHGQCRAAVHAGPEQRWASFVCRCGQTRQYRAKFFSKEDIESVNLNITLCSNLLALIHMHGMCLPHGVD